MSGDAPARGIAGHLRDARGRGRKLLVPYLTAGYPDRERCAEALAGLAGAGADAIELGVPFSDPLADGPVIAAASEQAIEAGASLESALELAGEYARAGGDRPPLVLFTYMNPVAAMGIDRVAEACREAGVAAVLVADLPYDEDPAVAAALARRDLPLIRLAAPTTPADRLAALASGAEGFVYLIARTGTTGAGAGTDERVAEQVAVIRAHTELPVVVGFGIGDPDAARRAAALADGVVVGSAFVERLSREGPAGAVEWMRTLRHALDRPASV